jgi:hypothetical protein
VALSSKIRLYRGLENHTVSFISVLFQLVEVQVAIGIRRGLIHLSDEGLVLFRRRQFAEQEATAASSAEAR